MDEHLTRMFLTVVVGSHRTRKNDLIDFIKDSTDAWLSRIRSPILGSIGLTFVVFNWKPLWYLAFSEQSVAVKFRFFDINTSNASLYYFPVLVGLLLALATPWVKLAGALMATRPVSLLRRLQFDQAHEQKIYRWEKEAEAEVAQAKVEEARERRAIDAAKRIEEAESISGSEVADEILEQRASNETAKIVDPFRLLEDLDSRERAVLRAMGQIDSEIETWNLGQHQKLFLSEMRPSIDNLTNVRLEVELKESLGILENLALAEKSSGGHWNLTPEGYRLFDLLL